MSVMSPKEAMMSVIKSKAYLNGVVRYVILPPLQAMADSSDATWDDSLVASAEGFLDLLLPPGK